MKILIATDAWLPQVNGVVRTLGHVAREARAFGADVEFLSPDLFWTLPMPSYPEIRLALVPPGESERRLDTLKPDAIHIATEGPLGHAMRRVCLKRGLPFTTSFHTRFPDYIAGRLPVPERWTSDLTWSWGRPLQEPGPAVVAPHPTRATPRTARGFHDVKLWSRGVDAKLFHPRDDADLDLPRPIYLTVGRVAVEKNLEAFLSLKLPGTKVVVGDGPARATLARQFPETVFLGARQGEDLARIYAAADVFVFPSLTDTFGLVLLEALASGVPVAAFPAAAPRDVIGQNNGLGPVGVLDDDLKRACHAALKLKRDDCRDFALGMTWEASARTFVQHVTEAARSGRQRLAA